MDDRDIVEILHQWARILTIPSGDFVNEDLRQAAAEIDRLRAELAAAHPLNARLARDLSALSADNAAKDARIAEADAKIGELKALRIHLEACNREAALDCKGLRARIAECMEALGAKDAMLADAQTRIAELEATIVGKDILYGQMCENWSVTLARAEKAEANCKRVTEEFEAYKVNYEYNDVDLDMAVELEMTLRKRAEAERDALREALKEISEMSPTSDRWISKARAALNPSPAGREG